MACGQEAELLKQAQRELEGKQQLQHVLEAQLSEETASLTTTQARANALEAQLKDQQEKRVALKARLQVCSITSPSATSGYGVIDKHNKAGTVDDAQCVCAARKRWPAYESYR